MTLGVEKLIGSSCYVETLIQLLYAFHGWGVILVRTQRKRGARRLLYMVTLWLKNLAQGLICCFKPWLKNNTYVDAFVYRNAISKAKV